MYSIDTNNGMSTYKVVCQNCNSDAAIEVDDSNKLIRNWLKSVPIVSARYRLDHQWGFECLCGNDTRLSEQEKRTIKNPVTPDPADLQQIINNLEIDNELRFAMEKI